MFVRANFARGSDLYGSEYLSSRIPWAGWGIQRGIWKSPPPPPPGRGGEYDLSVLCTWHAWGSWLLWMVPKNLNIRKARSCGDVLKYKGPSGVRVSLSLVLASMFIQFACEISALAWSLEFLRTLYKLVVPPRTASGTDLWELSQETLPATALPLLITSVTSAQETAAWGIPSREVWRSHRLLMGGGGGGEDCCHLAAPVGEAKENLRITHGGGGQLTIPLRIR